jgi:hypothetical protein
MVDLTQQMMVAVNIHELPPLHPSPSRGGAGVGGAQRDRSLNTETQTCLTFEREKNHHAQPFTPPLTLPRQGEGDQSAIPTGGARDEDLE